MRLAGGVWSVAGSHGPWVRGAAPRDWDWDDPRTHVPCVVCGTCMRYLYAAAVCGTCMRQLYAVGCAPVNIPPHTQGCSPPMGCDVRHLAAEGVAGTGFGVFGRCRVVVQLVSRWGGMVLPARGGGG